MDWLWLGMLLPFGADPPKPPPPQPPPDTGAADAAAAAEREKARKRRGDNANVLTSPTEQSRYATLGGVQRESGAALTTKEKLGG